MNLENLGNLYLLNDGMFLLSPTLGAYSLQVPSIVRLNLLISRLS